MLLSIIRQDQADRPTPAAPGDTKISSGSRRRSEPFICCKLFENERKKSLCSSDQCYLEDLSSDGGLSDLTAADIIPLLFSLQCPSNLKFDKYAR